MPEADVSKRMSDLVKNIRPLAQSEAESVENAIGTHIEQLQSKLGPDEELLVYYFTGIEAIRVTQFAFPSWHLVILMGTDGEGNTATSFSHISAVQFTCKIVKVQADRKAIRIGFIYPNQEK
jgi:hypothetical protein